MPKQSKQKPSSPVEYERPEVAAMRPTWLLIRAALTGERAIKALGELVLPRPNSTDTSAENDKRYADYITRAVWYNVSQRTLEGMVGYIFKKDPTITLPPVLKGLETSADGAGVSLLQQSKDAVRAVIGFGRGGLLVDYPQTEEVTTRQQLIEGNIQPTIVLIQAEQITNWRTTVEGAQRKLTMIVIKEASWEVGDDEFELIEVIQYRVLDIINEETDQPDGADPLPPIGTVRGRVFQCMGDGRDYFENHDLTYFPIDSNGQPLTTIPFVFLGWRNNDPEIDKPPMEDLVFLNIAHYRNSADYEEAAFMLGQPTPYVAGVTEQWAKNVLGGKIQLGSRGLISLPAGGTAGLVQCQPNSMPFEAMQHKETQMVALGAKLVQQQRVQRTATEAQMDNSSEVSVLINVAINVFMAYVEALKFAGQFVGADDATLEFELSEPLTRDSMTPQEATAISALWMQGLLDYEEARTVLKKSGLAYLDDDIVKQNHANELPPPLPPAGPPAPNPGPKPPAPMPAPPAPRPN